MDNVPNKIIVHTVASGKFSTVRDIDAFHKSRGFNKSQLGYYVGYHYLIAWNGLVTQTRKLEEFGCHCKGQNWCSIGIAFIGNNDLYEPSEAQVMSLHYLTRNLAGKYDISPNMILPHRVFANKTCYGSKLDDYWAQRNHCRGFTRLQWFLFWRWIKPKITFGYSPVDDKED